MPWHLIERDGQTCVVKDGEAEPVDGGCHSTRDEAQRHLAALYAAEPAAQGGVATHPSCSCGHGAPVARAAAATEPFDAPYPVPAYPPRAWFYERPEWFKTPDETMRAHLAAGGDQFDAPILKLQVADDGRVAGYFHEAGQCLVHRHDACPKPSPTRHAAFHQSDVVVEDGEMITVGIIGNVGGHANEFAPVSVAQAHYADPNAAVVSCRAYDDEHGSYLLGAVVPWATYGDVARARLHPLSGDWRPMADAWWKAHGISASAVRACEGYDSIGPTFVNRAGLPLVRSRKAALEDTMPDPVVVHQHFHNQPPGPQPDMARVAAVEAARTAADGPPDAPPADSGGGDGGGDTVSREEFDALVAVVTDLAGKVDALLQAASASADAEMAALEAAAQPLPTQVSV